MIKVCYIWHKCFKLMLPYWAIPERKQGLEGILFWNIPLEFFSFVTLWQDLSFLDLKPLGNSSRRNQDPYKFCKFFLNTPGNYTTFLINLTHRISTCSFSNTPLQKKNFMSSLPPHLPVWIFPGAHYYCCIVCFLLLWWLIQVSCCIVLFKKQQCR